MSLTPAQREILRKQAKAVVEGLTTKRGSGDPAEDFRKWAGQIGAIADEMEEMYGDDEGFQGIGESIDPLKEVASQLLVTADQIAEMTDDYDKAAPVTEKAIRTKVAGPSGNPEADKFAEKALAGLSQISDACLAASNAGFQDSVEAVFSACEDLEGEINGAADLIAEGEQNDDY